MKKLFFVLLVIVALVGCKKEEYISHFPHLGEWELRNPADINGKKWFIKIDEYMALVSDESMDFDHYMGVPYMLLYDSTGSCNDSSYLSEITNTYVENTKINIKKTMLIPNCIEYELDDNIESIAKSLGMSNVIYYNNGYRHLKHPILEDNDIIRFKGDILSIGYSIPEENREFIEKYRFLRVK